MNIIRTTHIFLISLISALIYSSALQSQSSVEINLGSIRPLNEYAANLSQGGTFDISGEFQKSLPKLFTNKEGYFPLSIGMKIGYNYYRVHKEKWGEVLVDIVELTDKIIIPYPLHEYKYTLRSHSLNMHPFLELSTPRDKNVVLFARYYFGPTFSWNTSKYRVARYDDDMDVHKAKIRKTYSKRPALDHGYKIGFGIKLDKLPLQYDKLPFDFSELRSSTMLVFSYTRLNGNEQEFLGKGSFKSFDRENQVAEYDYITSKRDRCILSIGLMYTL